MRTTGTRRKSKLNTKSMFYYLAATEHTRLTLHPEPLTGFPSFDRKTLWREEHRPCIVADLRVSSRKNSNLCTRMANAPDIVRRLTKS